MLSSKSLLSFHLRELKKSNKWYKLAYVHVNAVNQGGNMQSQEMELHIFKVINISLKWLSCTLMAIRCINFQSVFSHPSITYILKEKIDNFNPFHARKITNSELYSQRLFTFISVCYSIHINKLNMIVNHISCFRVYNNGEKLRHTALHKKFRVATTGQTNA